MIILFEDFDIVLERRINLTRKVLAEKAGEYATESDRFSNFRVAGKILGCSPEMALWGFAVKHLVSVIGIVEAVDQGEEVDLDLVDAKIGDLINYLILLECLIRR